MEEINKTNLEDEVDDSVDELVDRKMKLMDWRINQTAWWMKLKD